MWIPFTARQVQPAAPDATEQPPETGRPSPPRRKKRRAATTMEYAVMLSFILLVVIAAIQSFGISVGKLFTSDAAATSKAPPTTGS